MKEFTIEEKAKAYDEAIKRAKKLKEDPQGVFYEYSPKEGDTVCDYIFPELKENEDEKIRKAIYSVLKYLETDCSWDSLDEEVDILDAYDWLEKQGNTIPDECVFRPVAGCDIESAAKQAIKQQGVLAKKVVLAFNGAYIPVGGKAVDIIVNEYNSWLENQRCNLVENGYTNNKDIVKYADNYSHEIWHKLMDNFKNIKDYYIGCNDVSDIVLNAIIDTYNWLEKQRKEATCVAEIIDRLTEKEQEILFKELEMQKVQKPVNATDEDIVEAVKNISILDMVEPKFHKGDWVVTDYGKVNQVVSIDNDCDGFTLDDGTYFSGSWKDNYHLWSIADAKPGDVLVNGSNIFIFHFLNGTRLMGYCHINTDDGLFTNDIGKNECFCLIDAIVHPATKEQRDFLFQRMHEASYEWDAENKELHKFGLESVTFSINWKDKKAEE